MNIYQSQPFCWQLEAMPQLGRYFDLPIENGEFRWARCYSTWGFFPSQKTWSWNLHFFARCFGVIMEKLWWAKLKHSVGVPSVEAASEVNLKCTSCHIDQPWAVNRLAIAGLTFVVGADSRAWVDCVLWDWRLRLRKAEIGMKTPWILIAAVLPFSLVHIWRSHLKWCFALLCMKFSGSMAPKRQCSDRSEPGKVYIYKFMWIHGMQVHVVAGCPNHP